MSNENNGLMTKIWGPPGWLFLHCVTMGYPVSMDSKNQEHKLRKKQTKLFVVVVEKVIRNTSNKSLLIIISAQENH